MKLGLENREQVYFLAGLVVLAGFMMYRSWMPQRPPAPNPPPARFTPSRRGSKAIGSNEVRKHQEIRLPGAWL